MQAVEINKCLNILDQVKAENPQQVYIVIKNHEGKFRFYKAGRLHGFGTAVGIMMSEFSRYWNSQYG